MPATTIAVLKAMTTFATYNPTVAHLCGSVAAGILLSNALSHKAKTKEGWFVRNPDYWAAELGMSRKEFDGAIKALKALTLLEVRACSDLPDDRYYRADVDRLTALLAEKEEAGE